MKVGCVLIGLLTASSAYAGAMRGMITVQGTWDPWLYGTIDKNQPYNPGGDVPTPISLASDAQFVTFNATGSVTCLKGPGADYVGPAGGPSCTGISSNITGVNGISGLTYDNGGMELVGVFLGPNNPSGTSPNNYATCPPADPTNVTCPANPAYGFYATNYIGIVSAKIGQVFVVGTGSDSSGVQTAFRVPTGATRLILGVVDAYTPSTDPGNGVFQGKPGAYGDNDGSFVVNYLISTGSLITVDATNNPWNVGAPGGLNGGTPQVINLPANSKTVSFSAAGQESCNHNYTWDNAGPAGGTICGTSATSLNAVDGLSGFSDPNAGMPLVGAFLGPNTPSGNPPATLTAPNGPAVINQFFYIGTGRDTSDNPIKYTVPPGATRMVVGVADGYSAVGGPFTGTPSAYGDNGGQLLVSYDVTTAPEPATWLLLLSALGIVIAIRDQGTR